MIVWDNRIIIQISGFPWNVFVAGVYNTSKKRIQSMVINTKLKKYLLKFRRYRGGGGSGLRTVSLAKEGGMVQHVTGLAREGSQLAVANSFDVSGQNRKWTGLIPFQAIRN